MGPGAHSFHASSKQRSPGALDAGADSTRSVEGLQLVGLHRGLVFVQVSQGVLGPVVVGIVVRIDRLRLQASDGVEFLSDSPSGCCHPDGGSSSGARARAAPQGPRGSSGAWEKAGL